MLACVTNAFAVECINSNTKVETEKQLKRLNFLFSDFISIYVFFSSAVVFLSIVVLCFAAAVFVSAILAIGLLLYR